jgi:hypothetical protein
VETGDGGSSRRSRRWQVLLVGAVNCHLCHELPRWEPGLGGVLGGEVAGIGAWDGTGVDLPWLFVTQVGREMEAGREEKSRFEFRGKFLAGEEWRERTDLCFMPFLARWLHEPANLGKFREMVGGDRDLRAGRETGERGARKTVCGRLLRGCGRGRFEIFSEFCGQQCSHGWCE